jgi:hypothetical protein
MFSGASRTMFGIVSLLRAETVARAQLRASGCPTRRPIVGRVHEPPDAGVFGVNHTTAAVMR